MNERAVVDYLAASKLFRAVNVQRIRILTRATALVEEQHSTN